MYREGTKVSHYIVNSKTSDGGVMRFHIGDMVFPSLPDLLTFYKSHYLDTTPLVRPVRLSSVILTSSVLSHGENRAMPL